MLRHSHKKHNLSCFKSLLVTGMWGNLLSPPPPPIQSCSYKFWAWSCTASNFEKGWWGAHKHKIMDSPFKPKYGTVSQVLLQLVVALVCPQHDIWETSADIPHWWCISRQLWVVPNWLCREKNLLQPQRKTTKIYHLGSEPHQYGISTLFCSLISHGNQQWCHEMSATF